MPSHDPEYKVTRREVDGWLAQIQYQIGSLLSGPAGELRARMVLLQKRIERWRERLNARQGSGEPGDKPRR